MMICAYCSRPANTKRTERDIYQRVRDIYVCDDHEDFVPREQSQKEFMEARGFK